MPDRLIRVTAIQSVERQIAVSTSDGDVRGKVQIRWTIDPRLPIGMSSASALGFLAGVRDRVARDIGGKNTTAAPRIKQSDRIHAVARWAEIMQRPSGFERRQPSSRLEVCCCERGHRSLMQRK